MRRGFTLVEVMITSAIFVLVSAGVLTAFTGFQRLVVNGYETAELSVRMREIREKLLFHVVPPHGGKCYPGVLSGRAIRTDGMPVESGIKIYLSTLATKMNDGTYEDATIQLVKNELTGGGFRFRNDAESDDAYRTRWFSLGDAAYLSATNALDDSRLSPQKNQSRNLYFVNLEASLDHVTRRERVAVPAFGVEQKKGTTSVFHDTQGGGK